jgi:hypothetical protein
VEPSRLALFYQRFTTQPDWVAGIESDDIFMPSEYGDDPPLLPGWSTITDIKAKLALLCLPLSVATCIRQVPGQGSGYHCNRLAGYYMRGQGSANGGWSYIWMQRRLVQCRLASMCLTDPCTASDDPCCGLEGASCAPKSTRNVARPGVRD